MKNLMDELAGVIKSHMSGEKTYTEALERIMQITQGLNQEYIDSENRFDIWTDLLAEISRSSCEALTTASKVSGNPDEIIGEELRAFVQAHDAPKMDNETFEKCEELFGEDFGFGIAVNPKTLKDDRIQIKIDVNIKCEMGASFEFELMIQKDGVDIVPHCVHDNFNMEKISEINKPNLMYEIRRPTDVDKCFEYWTSTLLSKDILDRHENDLKKAIKKAMLFLGILDGDGMMDFSGVMESIRSYK